MAGGIAPKSHALIMTARAALIHAEKQLNMVIQMGNPASNSRLPTADAAVTAAITALQALT